MADLQVSSPNGEAGEPRREPLSMRVTATEKTALQVVAGMRGVEPATDLLRPALDEIVAEFQRLRTVAKAA